MNETTLQDRFQRQIRYLRLSVTDRCDLRCFYCMPKGHTDFEAPEDWLTFDEIERVVAAFARLGTHRVRITGGEPLVRRGLPELAARLNALPGLDDLSLSTNALQLQKHAVALAEAGVSRINVSLDTLKPERFKDITGGPFERVMDGLMAAKATGIQPIKINMVLMKGVNDDEVDAMVDFCKANDFTLRFIETMPMGDTGREASDHFVDLQQVRQQLERNHDLLPGTMSGGGPARYLRFADSQTNIGFITPLSQHFCETCNRVRLSVKGTLYMCLGQDHSHPLRPMLRDGCTDAELEAAIRAAIELKPEKHEFKENPGQIVRFMSYTGG